MKKVPFQVYLNDRDHHLLDQLARKQGLSMAETVRAAIRRWAMEETQDADPVLGLIGTFDAPGIPADLSTRHDEYAVYAVPGRGGRRVAEKGGRER